MTNNNIKNAKRKKQGPEDLNTNLSMLGKIQPQAPEMERAVLGALMLEKNAFSVVENILSENDFYFESNKLIYSAILRLANDNKPVDILTAVEELKRMDKLNDVGGPVYIAQLSGGVASAAHLEYHAKIIKQKSISRRLINITGKVNSMAFDESIDVAEVLECLEKDLSDLVSNSGGTQSVNMPAALNNFLAYVTELQNAQAAGKAIAVPTHLHALNKALEGGLRAGELVVIGARPSMGKTQHALAMAMAAAKAGQDCLFISIEMTLIELISRLMLEDESISSRNMHTGQMSTEEWKSIDNRIGELYNKSLFINDDPNIRYLTNIKSEARRLHRKGKLKLLVIDYLQKIRVSGTFERRQLEVGYITGELQNLAKELNIPIILLAQVKRPDKTGVPKPPDMDDLREAGDIEQDADIVLMLHCPAYYKDDAKPEEQSKLDEWERKGMLIVRKNRRGARNDTIIFAHDTQYKKIYDTEIDTKLPF